MKEPTGLYLQSPKLNRLTILKEIAANAKITQAKLAKLSSLSVAMVNNYMKELCGRGLLEYRRRSIKSVTYHLTPPGRLHLQTLELQQISEIVDMFVAAKERIKDRILSRNQSELRRVVLFGSGSLAQLAFHAIELTEVNIVGICSDDPAVVGSDFCGYEILNLSQIRALSPDAVIIADLPKTENLFQSLESILDWRTELISLNSILEPGSPKYLDSCPSLPPAANSINR